LHDRISAAVQFNQIAKIYKEYHKLTQTRYFPNHHSIRLIYCLPGDLSGKTILSLSELEEYLLLFKEGAAKTLKKLKSLETIPLTTEYINSLDSKQYKTEFSIYQSSTLLCLKGLNMPNQINDIKRDLIDQFKLDKSHYEYKRFNFCYNYIKEHYTT